MAHREIFDPASLVLSIPECPKCGGRVWLARIKALQCEHLACVTPDNLADQFLELTKQWRDIADQMERHGLFQR